MENGDNVVNGDGTGNMILNNDKVIDCTGIIEQVISVVGEQQNAKLESFNHTLTVQQQQLDIVMSKMENFMD